MLTDKGYQKPTTDEILEDIIESLQEKFGADIDVSATSYFGMIARYLASIYSELEENQEAVYNSGNILKATGVSLDRLAANYDVQRNESAYATVTLNFVGTPNYTIPNGNSYTTNDGLIFTLSEDVTLDSNGNGSGLAYSYEKGSVYNVGHDTIVNQNESLDDITTVTNELGASGGADQESDTSLRSRLIVASKGINSGTYNGLMSAISSVNGVKTVRIVENHSDKTDSFGNPPYSIHIYVLGGEKDMIARAILNSIAVGINTYGSVIVKVEDDAHNLHDVMFDIATTKDIYAKITLETNDKFPSDGIDLVQAQVKEYIESLSMGSKVRFSYLFKYIYDNVSGINVADVKIGTTKDNVAAADVSINPFEVANYKLENVEVIDG